jgi:hypothetical protein
MPKNGIQGLDELRAKLKNAPEKLRLQELYKHLRREANPLVNAIRQAAYEDVKKPTSMELWKSIKTERARVRHFRDTIGVWIGPTRVLKFNAGERQSYPWMQMYGSKYYPAKNYVKKGYERMGDQTRARVDRMSRSHFQKQLKQALQ